MLKSDVDEEAFDKFEKCIKTCIEANRDKLFDFDSGYEQGGDAPHAGAAPATPVPRTVLIKSGEKVWEFDLRAGEVRALSAEDLLDVLQENIEHHLNVPKAAQIFFDREDRRIDSEDRLRKGLFGALRPYLRVEDSRHHHYNESDSRFLMIEFQGKPYKWLDLDSHRDLQKHPEIDIVLRENLQEHFRIPFDCQEIFDEHGPVMCAADFRRVLVTCRPFLRLHDMRMAKSLVPPQTKPAPKLAPPELLGERCHHQVPSPERQFDGRFLPSAPPERQFDGRGLPYAPPELLGASPIRRMPCFGSPGFGSPRRGPLSMEVPPPVPISPRSCLPWGPELIGCLSPPPPPGPRYAASPLPTASWLPEARHHALQSPVVRSASPAPFSPQPAYWGLPQPAPTTLPPSFGCAAEPLQQRCVGQSPASFPCTASPVMVSPAAIAPACSSSQEPLQLPFQARSFGQSPVSFPCTAPPVVLSPAATAPACSSSQEPVVSPPPPASADPAVAAAQAVSASSGALSFLRREGFDNRSTPLGSTHGRIEVELQRQQEGDKFGFEITSDDRQRVLFINKVIDGGLLAQWNRRNPVFSLREGDAILSVNGQAEDADAMELELQRANEVRLQAQRR